SGGRAAGERRERRTSGGRRGPPAAGRGGGAGEKPVSGGRRVCYLAGVKRPALQQFDRSQLRITRVAFIILFLLVATSLIFAMTGHDGQERMGQWLAPFPNNVWHRGRVWTLLSGPFLEVHMINLVFEALMVWLFLPALERWWGPRRFTAFFVATALAGTLGGTLIGLATGNQIAIVGLEAVFFAATIAFGIIHARAQVQFFGVLPLTGRQLMWGMVAVMLAVLLIGQEWEVGGANVTASLVGAAIASGRVDPIAWWRRRRYAKTRSHLSVVPPPPVGAPPRRSKTDDRYLN
ncbi:MAG TPA: rhomboid family intramembrane serine protease, partial [Kofleriaceae bacterium]|nr:rhomboid family intramembrane serine protease [Kofleriaceae bacterium]